MQDAWGIDEAAYEWWVNSATRRMKKRRNRANRSPEFYLLRFFQRFESAAIGGISSICETPELLREQMWGDVFNLDSGSQ